MSYLTVFNYIFIQQFSTGSMLQILYIWDLFFLLVGGSRITAHQPSSALKPASLIFCGLFSCNVQFWNCQLELPAACSTLGNKHLRSLLCHVSSPSLNPSLNIGLSWCPFSQYFSPSSLPHQSSPMLCQMNTENRADAALLFISCDLRPDHVLHCSGRREDCI